MVVRDLVHGEEETPDGRICWMWCPGCDTAHAPRVVGTAGEYPGHGPHWDWDGNVERPTFSPSYLVLAPAPRCHSFIRAGQWEFLSDCEHALAGQTVAMVPLPDWLIR